MLNTIAIMVGVVSSVVFLIAGEKKCYNLTNYATLVLYCQFALKPLKTFMGGIR